MNTEDKQLLSQKNSEMLSLSDDELLKRFKNLDKSVKDRTIMFNRKPLPTLNNEANRILSLETLHLIAMKEEIRKRGINIS